MTNWNWKASRILSMMVFSALAIPPFAASAVNTGTTPLIPVEEFFKQDKLVNMKISPNGEYLAATVALADRTDLIFL